MQMRAAICMDCSAIWRAESLVLRSSAVAAESAKGPPEPMDAAPSSGSMRSEEHTSELQSPFNLVCRLLLEKQNDSVCPRVPRRARGPARLTEVPENQVAGGALHVERLPPPEGGFFFTGAAPPGICKIPLQHP